MSFLNWGRVVLFYLTIVFISLNSTAEAVSNLIEVEKKNVLHRFVRFDDATDHFTQNVFPSWEIETFEIFDVVKDPNGIAIDLGAWIGTTSIWLSKNFSHVVAVDGDPVSLNCLRMNLEASECFNVTICDKPISNVTQDVIFGPRGAALNESISYMKLQSDSHLDQKIKSITLKQLVHDTVLSNEELENKKIAFIKCDIEGGEEYILEDILYFSFYNKCPVYMSFHIDWWTHKNIADFQELFNYFEILNFSGEDIIEYLQAHPFASLLLYPKENTGDFIKTNIPALIIGYNQYTYIKNMVSQLEKYTNDIVIIDNNSDFKPLLDYYESDFKYTLLRQKNNYGHRVYQKEWVRNILGDVFILTDPDLQFNPHLPKDFIRNLISVSEYYQAGRVGFALLIDAEDIRTDITYAGFTIKEWESRFWEYKYKDYTPDPRLELYAAPIDTTFCLFNRKYDLKSTTQVRVAGNYTCIHIPWHINFRVGLASKEYEAYLLNNISTNWFGPKTKG